MSTVPSWADVDELDRLQVAVGQFAAGGLDPDAFRRLGTRHGVYRQGEDAYMVRVKIPGGVLGVDALTALADVTGRYSRGWGHITTRQNVEVHFVALEEVLPALRRLAEAGLTSRESGGDTVRNVTACQLAGVCRSEVCDVTGVAETLARHFLRNPVAGDLVRKFKIAVSGCGRDCALAAVQDVGIVAVDHDGRLGFRVLVGGGLGTDPRLATPLEEFTDARDLLPTVEAVLRVWDRSHADRARRTRVRVRHLVARQGIETVRAEVLAERDRLRGSTARLEVTPHGPARRQPSSTGSSARDADLRHLLGQPSQELSAWLERCVKPQREPGRYAVFAAARLGDVTSHQWRVLAAATRDLGVGWRTTVRQNLVGRDVADVDLPRLHRRLADAGLAAHGEWAAASIVSCPGTDTCQRALAPSRETAEATIDALEAAGLADAEVTINISGCTNSCAQQQLATVGLSGQVRRSGTREAPGYRILLGGGPAANGPVGSDPTGGGTVGAGTVEARTVEARTVEAGSVSLGRYTDRVSAEQAAEVVVGFVRRHLATRRASEC